MWIVEFPLRNPACSFPVSSNHSTVDSRLTNWKFYGCGIVALFVLVCQTFSPIFLLEQHDFRTFRRGRSFRSILSAESSCWLLEKCTPLTFRCLCYCCWGPLKPLAHVKHLWSINYLTTRSFFKVVGTCCLRFGPFPPLLDSLSPLLPHFLRR